MYLCGNRALKISVSTLNTSLPYPSHHAASEHGGQRNPASKKVTGHLNNPPRAPSKPTRKRDSKMRQSYSDAAWNISNHTTMWESLGVQLTNSNSRENNNAEDIERYKPLIRRKGSDNLNHEGWMSDKPYGSYSSITRDEIFWWIRERKAESGLPLIIRSEMEDLLGFHLTISEFYRLWNVSDK